MRRFNRTPQNSLLAGRQTSRCCLIGRLGQAIIHIRSANLPGSVSFISTHHRSLSTASTSTHLLGQPRGEILLVESKSNGVTTLTLNRPSKRNALSEELLLTLEAQLDNLAAAKDVRCVVLQASGGTVFSSGHDLAELRLADTVKVRSVFETCSRVMLKLAELPQPTISVVEGLATAAGLQLALSCDFVVAHDRATFATPGVDIGLFCSTPSVAFFRNGGNERLMKDMLFTGRKITAKEALNGGLITRVSADPLHEALDIASIIASKSPTALRIGKRTIREHTACRTLSEAYSVATDSMIKNMATADATEGIAAFLDKRKPTWTN